MFIGIDTEEVARFELDRDNAFIISTFTSEEINYAFTKTKPAMHLAGIFCAKEATVKAFGNKDVTISLKDVSISYRNNGAPIARVWNIPVQISLSHTKETAIAIALLED